MTCTTENMRYKESKELLILKLREKGLSYRQIEKETGVSFASVGRIIRGRKEYPEKFEDKHFRKVVYEIENHSTSPFSAYLLCYMVKQLYEENLKLKEKL
ncbi:Trp family transcriptional regulator [Halobacteriovorax sp. GB3]|uniref:Trp family transcriptional regulator n=1 Tax=Halobacteriovorax sp. GB3 TaxID=2719615 RepID=UPI00235DDE8C|nr:Trp family transcriptional regulator [Halobacteriovorax sp. GB3]MDD0853029.1 Trp family transcriptional regulator [Halobacteriovorax sp. GB3]